MLGTGDIVPISVVADKLALFASISVLIARF
jgi:hypothetical protein